MDINNPYSRVYPHLYRGVIEDNIDPEGLGRCRVRVPSVHGQLTYPVDMIPWARPIVLSPVGSNRGSVNLPAIGDIVWVMFEGANREFPVYFGGTYATGDISVRNDIVNLYLEDDTEISYDKNSRVCKLKVGDSQLEISPISMKVIGDLTITESLHVSGNLKVDGVTTLKDLVVTGDYSKGGE